MLSFILGFTATHLLTANRDSVRKSAVQLIVVVARGAQKVQHEVRTLAAGITEDLQDIVAEARAQHDAKKALPGSN